MSKSICSKDHLNLKKVVKVFFERLGFISMCKGCALDIIIKKGLYCKRYAISEREAVFYHHNVHQKHGAFFNKRWFCTLL